MHLWIVIINHGLYTWKLLFFSFNFQKKSWNFIPIKLGLQTLSDSYNPLNLYMFSHNTYTSIIYIRLSGHKVPFRLTHPPPPHWRCWIRACWECWDPRTKVPLYYNGRTWAQHTKRPLFQAAPPTFSDKKGENKAQTAGNQLSIHSQKYKVHPLGALVPSREILDILEILEIQEITKIIVHSEGAP